jgi:putative transferase (TIGR04331 family)
MKNILVTTAIEETWGNVDDNQIFLGEWCKSYDKRHLLNNKNESTLSHHWENRKKFKKDYFYLDELNERVLASLSKALNSYHGTDKDSKYWRIVVGPWLLHFLASTWSHWESIRIAFENNSIDETYVLECDTQRQVPSNSLEAIIQFGESHIWNHLLCARILKCHYSYGVTIKKLPYSKVEYNDHSCNNGKKSIKDIATIFLSRIFKKIQKKQKVVFFSSYFRLRALVKITLKIGQLPIINDEFNDVITMPSVSISSRKAVINLDDKNEFELFIKNNIISYIPISHLEGYNKIINKSKSILPFCDVIFTATGHWYNDFFKVWCAEKVEQGKKLIISSHGGSIAYSSMIFLHEEKISNVKVVWGTPIDGRQLRLPPNKILGHKHVNKNLKRCFISIIGLEDSLYVYRCKSGPNSSMILNDYSQKVEFIKRLDIKIQKKLLVRPYSNKGWNTRQRYIDEFGINKISKHKTLLEQFNHSKIIVCTYPQTTLFEAMYSGVPTILLYVEDYWDSFYPQFGDLINKMKEAEIIFSDPFDAAHHINKIWDNPYKWWHSEKVIYAREYFFEMCGSVDNNWINEWSDFFKEELKSTN